MRVSDKPLGYFGEVFFSSEVESDPAYKGGLIARMVEELVERACIPADGRAHVEVCFDEAVTNAMQHGNRMDAAKKVRVWLFADDKWWGALLEDEGEGFDPHALPDPEAKSTQLGEAGRGISVMDRYVDDLVFGPRGNQVLLARRRRTESEAPSGRPRRRASPLAVKPLPAAPAPASAVQTVGPARVWAVEGAVVVEVFAPRVDDMNVRAFKEALLTALDLGPTLVVDLSTVSYLSSVVIGALVMGLKRALEKGGGLVLCGLQPLIQDIFHDSRMDRLFPIALTREEAVESVRRAAGGGRGGRGRER
ncbi:MAG: ATP-binding protein [Planctomycetes bacterium]|nr:ATP-binding protein [Planctomycetota bacterium]